MFDQAKERERELESATANQRMYWVRVRLSMTDLPVSTGVGVLDFHHCSSTSLSEDGSNVSDVDQGLQTMNRHGVANEFR